MDYRPDTPKQHMAAVYMLFDHRRFFCLFPFGPIHLSNSSTLRSLN